MRRPSLSKIYGMQVLAASALRLIDTKETVEAGHLPPIHWGRGSLRWAHQKMWDHRSTLSRYGFQYVRGAGWQRDLMASEGHENRIAELARKYGGWQERGYSAWRFGFGAVPSGGLRVVQAPIGLNVEAHIQESVRPFGREAGMYNPTWIAQALAMVKAGQLRLVGTREPPPGPFRDFDQCIVVARAA